MPSARDVATYLLSRGARTPLRLQKLLYYSQAWSLVWDGHPLFGETIRAWDMGPVVGEVWFDQRNGALRGDPDVLTQSDRETIDAVLAWYGTRPDDWLSELTHRERPWLDAYLRDARPSPVITHDAIRAFYGASERDAGKSIPRAYQRGAQLIMSLSPEELAELADDSVVLVTAAELAMLRADDGVSPWPSS